MNRKAKILLPLLVLLFGAAVAAAVILARPKVERVETAVPPPLVRVVEAQRRDLPLVVRSHGNVAPQTQSVLVSELAGRLVSVAPSFAAGGFFRRGDALATIDPRDYELAVAQAAAAVAQAKVRLEVERAEAELARAEWAELGRGEGTALTAREPQLAEARSTLEAAEAALAKARLDLERTAVRAPFDGRIREKLADLGQFVAKGTPLASVFSTEWAEVRLPVPKADLAFVELDLGAASNPGGPDVLLEGEIGGVRHTWPARVVRTGSELDPRSRMLPVYARVEDPFGRRPGAAGAPLPMGLFVEARIEGKLAKGVVALPRAALRGEGEVLVVDGESRLRFRPVDVLRLERDRVILAAGVEPGEQICVSPLETVVDGMRVRTVVESGRPATDAQIEGRL